MHGSSNDPFSNFNSDPFGSSNKKNEEDFTNFFTGIGDKKVEQKQTDEFANIFGNNVANSMNMNENKNLSGGLYNEDDILNSFDSGEQKQQSFDKIFEATQGQGQGFSKPSSVKNYSQYNTK